MILKELEHAVLTVDLPEYHLLEGDIGVIVLVHGQGEGYEIEFFTLDGKTIDVVTVHSHQVRSIGKREIASARLME